MKQSLRSNNVEIQDVNGKPNENLLTVVDGISKFLNFQIQTYLIETVFRVPTQSENKPKNIIIKSLSKILPKKCETMGFRGKCFDLLTSYSTRRKQCTEVNGKISSKRDTHVGLAQGSVLGPLQYLLYVQSLKYAGLKGKYFMFCDDTVIVYSAINKEDLELTVNSDLQTYLNGYVIIN